MASTGAAADHIEHVKTQLPYAIIIGISAATGFLSAGLTQNAIVSMVITAAVLLSILYFLNRKAKKENLKVSLEKTS